MEKRAVTQNRIQSPNTLSRPCHLRWFDVHRVESHQRDALVEAIHAQAQEVGLEWSRETADYYFSQPAARLYHFGDPIDWNAPLPTLFTAISAAFVDSDGILVLEHFWQQVYTVWQFDGSPLICEPLHDADLFLDHTLMVRFYSKGGFHHYEMRPPSEEKAANKPSSSLRLLASYGDLDLLPSLSWSYTGDLMVPGENGFVVPDPNPKSATTEADKTPIPILADPVPQESELPNPLLDSDDDLPF